MIGSAMKAAIVSGALLGDQGLDLGDHAVAEGCFALALVRVAVVVRTGGVQHARHRQVEGLVIDGDAGEAAGRVGQAVIGAEPGDDLLLLGLAAQVVVVADQLEVGVVGVRAARAEEDLREVRAPALS